MVIAGSLLAAAAFPVTFAAFGVSGSDVVHAAENGAQSLSDLLGQRSPGARTAARLTKTKKARALAKVRQAPAGPSPVELAKILLAPPEHLPVDLGKPMALLEVAPPPFETIIGPPGGIVGSPPGGGGSPPGGVGGLPPGGGPPLVRQPDSPTSAVPEPGTWATMLLGFGLLGWRMRRERKARPVILQA
jgi:PEP-CTERM motif